MFIYLVLLFTIIPAIELALLITIGARIGVGYTIGIIILTGITGAFLAKWEGLLTLRKIQEDLSQGKMPADRLFDGILILCSGLLLLTPGFLTDGLGFLGLIPYTRDLIKYLIKRKISDLIDRGYRPKIIIH